MVELDLDQILETTDTIVQELLATGEFGNCTFKDVLLRVDARLELPRGTLLLCEHKSTVKKRVKELLLRAEKTGDQTPSPKKRTVGPESRAGAKPNKRRKPDTTTSNREGSDADSGPKKAKKSRPMPKPKAKVAKVDKVSKSDVKKPGINSKASGNKPAISAETIDSDLDNTDPGPSTSRPPPPASMSSPEGKLNQKLIKSDSEDTTSPSQVTKSQHSSQRPKTEKIPEVLDNSESELSVLLDDEPPKRRRKAKVEKNEPKPKGTRQKKEKKESSKDEETIKRLKSLVVACGVRKAWSKEFKDLESHSAQIKRLKLILTELGMTGRMSMERARAIKEKREFAQELEDIQDFEKKVAGGSRKKKGAESSDGGESDNDDDDDDGDEGKPPKKRINARNSINAFLGDQSDED